METRSSLQFSAADVDFAGIRRALWNRLAGSLRGSVLPKAAADLIQHRDRGTRIEAVQNISARGSARHTGWPHLRA